MNQVKQFPQRYLRPMVRSAETPRLFSCNSVGHLRVAIFLQLPKNYMYEQF